MNRILLLVAFTLFLAPRAASAQQPAPLETFVARVAALWAAGDASSLVDLAPEDGRLIVELEPGSGGTVDARHAAAALRELFGRREHVSIRATEVTVSGGAPPRGYGELSWTFRDRGVRDADRAVVYVGAEFERGAWRIRELRLIR